MNIMWYVDNFYNKNPKLRTLVSRILFGNRDVDVRLFDLDIRINSLKESGYLRASKMSQKGSLFRDEISIIQNLSALIQNDIDTFVDIGANIGIFSCIFSRFKNIYKNFNVIAFEANPDTYKRLDINAKRHGFQCYNYALSSFEGDLEFIEGSVSHVFTTVENASRYHPKDAPRVKVLSKRLDQFQSLGDSLIIKIDVEGQELQVLEGARSLFEQAKVKALYLDGFSNQKEVFQLLHSFGFQLLCGKSLTSIDPELKENIFSLLAVSKAFLCLDSK